MDQDYWVKQEEGKPLFGDILWNKPEQKSQAGKLLIIGGSAHGFKSVVNAYQTAIDNGAGQAKVILPDVLQKQLPPNFMDGIFISSNDGGGFSVKDQDKLLETAEWADAILLIGDTGMNSETAVLHHKLVAEINKPIVACRDAVDLLLEDAENVANTKNLSLVMTFAQTQKLFQKVYYPKILTFSMNLLNFIECLHKFTVTYPVNITTYHQGSLVSAHNGEVITQKSNDQLSIIDGTIAAKTATYLLWNSDELLQSSVASWQA